MGNFVRALILVSCCWMGCSGSRVATTTGPQKEVLALGPLDRNIFEQSEYKQFKRTYDTVNVNEDFVALIRQVRAGVSVTVFFGTWCSDSKREVPRFLKIADQAGFSTEQIKLYGLDRSKKSLDGLTERFHIELIPTFIFVRNGEEVGRITEKAHPTLEAEMLSILANSQTR